MLSLVKDGIYDNRFISIMSTPALSISSYSLGRGIPITLN